MVNGTATMLGVFEKSFKANQPPVSFEPPLLSLYLKTKLEARGVFSPSIDQYPWLTEKGTDFSAEMFRFGTDTGSADGVWQVASTPFTGDTSFNPACLPFKPLTLALGILLAIPGLYFLAVTNKLLRALGSGTNAFILTKRIVDDHIYKRTRNPMSLGFYLCSLAFASSSTFVLLAASLGLIPAHIFFLKYFEELELKLCFGESYLEYKKSVPFLIPRLKP